MAENKPFFMMIEGSQIDWCGHQNDIACAMREMDDFTASVKVAKAYVDSHPNSLLIITADHSTGGLGIGKKLKKSSGLAKKERKRKSYLWSPDIIKKVNISAKLMTKKLFESGNVTEIRKLFKEQMQITLSDKEAKKLAKMSLKPCKKFRKCKLHDQISKIVDKRSYTSWTTHGHTAVDVPLFAYGKGADAFHGFMDNIEIAQKLFKLLAK